MVVVVVVGEATAGAARIGAHARQVGVAVTHDADRSPLKARTCSRTRRLRTATAINATDAKPPAMATATPPQRDASMRFREL